jgi:two-component sensor histidine kinase
VQALPQADKQALLISVRDEGVGLPPGFDPDKSKRLGSRLVNALSKQLGSELTRPMSAVGVKFTLLIPL